MYDIDKEYDSWLQEQIDHLRARHFEKLDINNLIEELEALVRGEKAAVESLTINILSHLTYCQYWQEQSISKNHWRAEIAAFRFQLNNKLSTNLKNHLANNWDELKRKAAKIVRLKTGLSFPINYSVEQLLDEDYLP